MTDSNQHSRHSGPAFEIREAIRVAYLGDTSQLNQALIELDNLEEQLQAVQKHRDQLADMAREQEDENRRLLEQLEASERRASRNASAADIYKKQAEENGKAAIREEHRAETLEEQLQSLQVALTECLFLAENNNEQSETQRLKGIHRTAREALDSNPARES